MNEFTDVVRAFDDVIDTLDDVDIKKLSLANIEDMTRYLNTINLKVKDIKDKFITETINSIPR